MKVAGLISGGKDSVFNLMHCVALGHDIVCLVNLSPADSTTNIDEESFMFQTAGHDLLDVMAAECFELPLIRQPIRGRSLCLDATYTLAVTDRGEHGSDSLDGDNVAADVDEVEDLFHALDRVRLAFPQVDAVAVGAILSNYQRVRVEHVCQRLGLRVLGFLWRQPQTQLVEAMLDHGLEARLVKVASLGLQSRHLGRRLDEVLPELRQLSRKFGVHVAGEGGEYETIVVACPLFRRRLCFDDWQVLEEGACSTLRAIQCHTEPYTTFAMDPDGDWKLRLRSRVQHQFMHGIDPLHNGLSMRSASSKTESPAEPIMAEFRAEMERISAEWAHRGLQWKDAVMVTILLSDMSHFSHINSIYGTYLGVNHPASRSCVAVGPMPLDRHVSIMAVTSRATSRRMHVQSLSYWAPANIGPYSQAVHVPTQPSAIPSAGPGMGRIYLAGQIPLNPCTMTLPTPAKPAFMNALALDHVAAILEAMLDNDHSTLVTGHRTLPAQPALSRCSSSSSFSNAQLTMDWTLDQPYMISNAICYTQTPDAPVQEFQYEWLRRMSVSANNDLVAPTTYVAVNELPRQSPVEWEVQAVTRKDGLTWLEWDTAAKEKELGRDFDVDEQHLQLGFDRSEIEKNVLLERLWLLNEVTGRQEFLSALMAWTTCRDGVQTSLHCLPRELMTMDPTGHAATIRIIYDRSQIDAAEVAQAVKSWPREWSRLLVPAQAIFHAGSRGYADIMPCSMAVNMTFQLPSSMT